MGAVRGGGVWLMAWALAGCANAGSGQESTWPVWQLPEPVASAAPDEPPVAMPAHELPEGRLGLRPVKVDAPRGHSTPSPWAQLPIHGSVFHYLAHVYEAPRSDARAVGYMRRGTPLRAGEEVGRDGCDGGWHPVWGGGFVCRGQGYRLHAQPATREASAPAPNLADPMPYRYVKVVAPTAQTWRLPSRDEEARVRTLIATQPPPATDGGAAPVDGGSAEGGPAAAKGDGGTADAAAGNGWELPSWVRMLDEPGHYLSVAGEVTREDGKVFVQTVRGALVPRDATVEVQAPAFQGTLLTPDTPLPVAIALHDAGRHRLGIDGKSQGLPDLPRGALLSLTGEQRVAGGQPQLLARDGSYVDARRVVVVEGHPRPALVPPGARWVHVNVRTQTLTAYEGERPVYVTLVSTGKPGFDTPEGLHRVHAKHVTATMDDTALSEGAYYIEDVPWTMYFQGSYALHAAFWHERFGRSRSHGCVNLAPADAHWLFGFLTPNVPGGRHGVLVPGERPSYVLVEASEPGAARAGS